MKSCGKNILKLIITIDNKIRDEKLQYDINREAAKMLTSGENNYLPLKVKYYNKLNLDILLLENYLI